MAVLKVLYSKALVRTAKRITDKRKRDFEKDFAAWEYNHPRNKTNDAPIAAVISSVDCIKISLRIMSEKLLTLLVTIIDVAEINLLRANALILSENPSIQERKIIPTDSNLAVNIKSRCDDNVDNSPVT